jgi:protein gp37
MSTTTGIEWTDATWNPVVGCERVSPGCAHCYAKQLHDQRHNAHLAGHQMAKQYHVPFETVQLKPERLTAPLGWRKPRRVFVNSVSDLFHDAVPSWFVDRVFAVMAGAQRHTFQVLTKRPERMRAYLTADGLAGRIAEALDRLCDNRSVWNAVLRDPGDVVLWGDSGATAVGARVNKMVNLRPWPLPNVWLGVSVENQRFADERIPLLLRTPAAVRFLSCEPLLGPVDLEAVRHSLGGESFEVGSVLNSDDGFGLNAARNRIDWVIVGGESGPKYRPMRDEWARAIRDDCVAADVPFFFKQWGGRTPKSGGRSLDGREWNEMPGRPSEVTHG